MDFTLKNTTDFAYKNSDDFIYAGLSIGAVYLEPNPAYKYTYNTEGVRIRVSPLAIRKSANLVVLKLNIDVGASINDCYIGYGSPNNFAFVPGSQKKVTFNKTGNHGDPYTDVVTSDTIVFGVNQGATTLISFNHTGYIGHRSNSQPGDSSSYVTNSVQPDPSSQYPQSGFSYPDIWGLFEIDTMTWDGAGNLQSNSVITGAGGVYENINGSGVLLTTTGMSSIGVSRDAVSGSGTMGNPSALNTFGWAQIFGTGDLLQQSHMLTNDLGYVFFYNF